MQRFKRLRLGMIVGLGVVPFTGLPMAVQVGLAVGLVVLAMALSAVARNPGTLPAEGTPDPQWPTHPAPQAIADEVPHPVHHPVHHSAPSDQGGAADSGQAANSASDAGAP
ncbi:hypothetical protein NX862_13755 [Rhodobacter sp. KR11]|uniref:hypothetical protein n=1 Tax=Rhodobacter sp. KR11 TaxID=2974588 RepID=UPI0022226D1F|nr:hypothetical protein [Rhodobacter sp. KR11]MCW1919821.1 hypothetical protein [Rhodobacter sp. KR11]